MAENILKEMCLLAGQIIRVIDQTKDWENRQKLWSRYNEITQLIEQMANKEFEDNDFFFDSLEKIRDMRQMLEENTGSIDMNQLIAQLSNIISNVHKLLLTWRAVNEQ